MVQKLALYEVGVLDSLQLLSSSSLPGTPRALCGWTLGLVPAPDSSVLSDGTDEALAPSGRAGPYPSHHGWEPSLTLCLPHFLLNSTFP